jgi:hypothetical protein
MFKATGDHDYRGKPHCHYCGTKENWPLARQPCPRAKSAINQAASKQRLVKFREKRRAQRELDKQAAG